MMAALCLEKSRAQGTVVGLSEGPDGRKPRRHSIALRDLSFRQ